MILKNDQMVKKKKKINCHPQLLCLLGLSQRVVPSLNIDYFCLISPKHILRPFHTHNFPYDYQTEGRAGRVQGWSSCEWVRWARHKGDPVERGALNAQHTEGVVVCLFPRRPPRNGMSAVVPRAHASAWHPILIVYIASHCMTNYIA